MLDTPDFSTWPILSLIRFAHEQYLKNAALFHDNEKLRLELKTALECINYDWK